MAGAAVRANLHLAGGWWVGVEVAMEDSHAIFESQSTDFPQFALAKLPSFAELRRPCMPELFMFRSIISVLR